MTDKFSVRVVIVTFAINLTVVVLGCVWLAIHKQTVPALVAGMVGTLIGLLSPSPLSKAKEDANTQVTETVTTGESVDYAPPKAVGRK